MQSVSLTAGSVGVAQFYPVPERTCNPRSDPAPTTLQPHLSFALAQTRPSHRLARGTIDFLKFAPNPAGRSDKIASTCLLVWPHPETLAPMKHPFVSIAVLSVFLPCAISAGSIFAQAKPTEKHSLYEDFKSQSPVRVEIQTTLGGRLAIPDRGNERGGKPQLVTVTGTAKLVYEEVLLPRDAEGNLVAVRQYREVDFRRRLGDTDQKAEVRAAVRRMVVVRSDAGKKVPFSPDGPLTLAEIDVVRNDLFSPALVTGLLPKQPAGVGNRWPASTQAVTELTDYAAVEKNELVVELVAFVTLDNRRHAKLTLTGEVRGQGEDGFGVQTFAGTAYFDMDRKMLVSLNLSAKNQLLGPDGKTVNGEVAGTFVVKRSPAAADELTGDKLKAIETKPTDATTRLLFDDAAFGLTFTYPRRWRLGTVGEHRLTVNEATGAAGIQVTRVGPTDTTIAKQFDEAKAFVARQKWTLTSAPEPKAGDDRFTLEVAADAGDKLRLDYRLVASADGVAVLSARLPVEKQAELLPQVESIFASVKVLK